MNSYGELFRPEIPWDVVREVVVPGVLQRPNQARVWVAGRHAVADGCTLALLWRSTASADLRVVATDLALQGSTPRFTRSEVERVPAELSSWLVEVDGTVVLDQRASALVAMAPLDVAREPWPRQLDLIAIDGSLLGRDKAGQAARIERLAAALHSHSWLLIGGLMDPTSPEGRFTTVDARGVFRKGD